MSGKYIGAIKGMQSTVDNVDKNKIFKDNHLDVIQCEVSRSDVELFI